MEISFCCVVHIQAQFAGTKAFTNGLKSICVVQSSKYALRSLILPHPEPVDSSPHTIINVFVIHFNIIFTYMLTFLKCFSFLVVK
jgi:hypothetical protein